MQKPAKTTFKNRVKNITKKIDYFDIFGLKKIDSLRDRLSKDVSSLKEAIVNTENAWKKEVENNHKHYNTRIYNLQQRNIATKKRIADKDKKNEELSRLVVNLNTNINLAKTQCSECSFVVRDHEDSRQKRTNNALINAKKAITALSVFYDFMEKENKKNVRIKKIDKKTFK